MSAPFRPTQPPPGPPFHGEEYRAVRGSAHDRAVLWAIGAVALLGVLQLAAATLIHLGRAWGW